MSPLFVVLSPQIVLPISGSGAWWTHLLYQHLCPWNTTEGLNAGYLKSDGLISGAWPKISVCASAQRSWGKERGGIASHCPMSPSLDAAFPWPSPCHCWRGQLSMIHPGSIEQGMPLEFPNEHLWDVVELSVVWTRPCPCTMVSLETAGMRKTCPGSNTCWAPSSLALPVFSQCSEGWPRMGLQQLLGVTAHLWTVFYSSPSICNFSRVRGFICQ